MHCKSVCLSMAMLLVIHVSDAVKMKIGLLKDDADTCSKYVKNGPASFLITHARILELDDDGTVSWVLTQEAIIGNILCEFKDPVENVKYETKCLMEASGPNKFKRMALMLSVTVRNSEVLVSQIEYRYKEDSMRLFENGFLELDRLAKVEFKHDQHIQIKSLHITDFAGQAEVNHAVFDSCHESFPGSLIADHGIFVTEIDRTNKKLDWKRMYFDPAGKGEKLVVK